MLSRGLPMLGAMTSMYKREMRMRKRVTKYTNMKRETQTGLVVVGECVRRNGYSSKRDNVDSTK